MKLLIQLKILIQLRFLQQLQIALSKMVRQASYWTMGNVSVFCIIFGTNNLQNVYHIVIGLSLIAEARLILHNAYVSHLPFGIPLSTIVI